MQLSYDMFLTSVFTRAQLPIDGHKADNKRLTTTMKTFSALGLKPQALEKEKKKEKKKKKEKEKEEKKKDSSIQKDVVAAQKVKTNPSKEKKKRPKRSLSPISEGRRINKRRLLKLVEDYSLEDGESATAAEPMDATTLTTELATRVSRPIKRDIVIREPLPQA